MITEMVKLVTLTDEEKKFLSICNIVEGYGTDSRWYYFPFVLKEIKDGVYMIVNSNDVPESIKKQLIP